MKPNSTDIQPLLNLGLTDLEARIYIFLLSENPATGYRIAKAVGKPAANTYEAIRSLESKGALVVNEDKKRLCRPVPLKQFLSQLKQQFESQLLLAEDRLQKRESVSGDERIYQIRNADQVMAQCRSILEKAKEIVLVDAFPNILKRISTHIERTARRGVETYLKTYEPMKIRGVKTVCDPRGPLLQSVYPGDWLRMVADGQEYLLAYLTDDGTKVNQAVWSANSFMSLMEHFDMWTEIHMAKLACAIEADSGQNSIRRILSEHRRSRRERLTGYQSLLSSYPQSSVKDD